MERNLLKIIRNQVDYPNVSILMTTHKTAPDNKQDTMVLKKLSKQAEKRLKREFNSRNIKGLLEKLKKTVASIDLRHNLDGLAIFLNNNFEKVVRLPFPVKDRIIIDGSFATRDLIRAMNRGINYYTLSISAGFVRLFEAYRDRFSEITESGFPYANPFPRGSNLEESTSLKETRLKEFFKMVDKSFVQIHNQHPMPLVIAGVEKNIALYREISGLPDKIITAMEGNYDNISSYELAQIVWPKVKEIMAQQRKEALKNLDKAIGRKRLVTGIDEVWQLATQNRGELLVVEEGFHQSAKINNYANSITLVNDHGHTGATDDLVDDIAEKVVSTGGRVIFAENGSLNNYDHIALVIKY
ncbi:MAG: hypothetical protein R6U58_11615 [Bacteroidales bacterium]